MHTDTIARAEQQIPLVAAAWAKVLRESRFSDWIDPGSLADLLRARREVLMKGGRIDLAPLWSAFSRAYNPQALCGLFLQLARESQALGVPALLPPVLAQLSPNERAKHLERFARMGVASGGTGNLPRASSSTGDLTPLPNLELVEAVDAAPLRTGDVSPMLSEELRRRIVQTVVQCIKSSPIGWRVNSASLRDFVTQHMHQLTDGTRFDFTPVYSALRKDPSISEPEMYIAAVRLIEALRKQHITMTEPASTLSPTVKARLWEEAQRIHVPPPNAAATLLPTKTPRLGELLVQHRMLTPEQLERALQHQRTKGGRLGTNLLELGYVQETALSHFLAVQLGIPAADINELVNIPAQVLALIPLEIAKRHKVVPLAVEGRRLRLAMVDPTDLAVLHEIHFLTGLELQAVIAPESMVHYALELHYAVPSPRPHAHTGSLPLPLPAAPAREPEPFEVVQASSRTGDLSGPIQIEERSHFYAQQRSDLGKDELRELSRALLRANEAREIFFAVREHLAQELVRVAVFLLDGATLFGATQSGCRVDEAHFQTLALPLAELRTFREPYNTLRPLVAPPPATRQDEWLAATLGFLKDQPLLCLPLVEHQRVVGFALAGPKRSGDPYAALSRYERIAGKVGAALQMVSMRRQIERI